jgi:hypothetical protein
MTRERTIHLLYPSMSFEKYVSNSTNWDVQRIGTICCSLVLPMPYWKILSHMSGHFKLQIRIAVEVKLLGVFPPEWWITKTRGLE